MFTLASDRTVAFQTEEEPGLDMSSFLRNNNMLLDLLVSQETLVLQFLSSKSAFP